MRRWGFHIIIIALLAGCELLGQPEDPIKEGDLQVVTDSFNYVATRIDMVRAVLELKITYTNNSNRRVYLAGCGNIYTQLERNIENEWTPVHAAGRQACNYWEKVAPEYIEPGDSREIDLAWHSDPKYDANWAVWNASGTYRITFSAYSNWSPKKRTYSNPVPASGHHSNSFEVLDECEIFHSCRQ